ncbi:MAG: molybdopterin oxidoreductase [Oscillibacter sp.]|nr:molybdopterin oxidoreductase [Oscillibacter sp.]
MKDRDFLWCLVNTLLDDEEELERLCPACRTRAMEERCTQCGAPTAQSAAGINESFDMERFLALKGGTGA